MASPESHAFVRAHCVQSLAKNVKQYFVRSYEGGQATSSFGFPIDFGDAVGRIVAHADGYIGIKTSPNRFCVIPTTLCSVIPNVGDDVAVSFYKAMRFDGKRVSGVDDGDGSRYCLGNSTQFPVTWTPDPEVGRYERDPYGAESKTQISNPYLIDMVRQLEEIKCHDGRLLVSVLRDAYVEGLAFKDPSFDQSWNPDRTLWPAIEMRARNHAGDQFNFAIRYNRGNDTYSIDSGGDSFDNVHFDELVDVICPILDDDSWRMAKVTITKVARKLKPLKVAA